MEILLWPVACTLITVGTALLWGEMRYHQGYRAGMAYQRAVLGHRWLQNKHGKTTEVESDLG